MVDTQFERRVRAALALYTTGTPGDVVVALVASALRDTDRLRDQLTLRLVEAPSELRPQ